MLGAERHLDRGVAEKVGEGPLLGRLRPDGQRRGDPPLHPGQVGRQQPQQMPPGHRRPVVLVGDGHADVVEHQRR